MKASILKQSFITVLFCISLMGCNNSPAAKEKDLNEATEDLVNAKEELDQAEYDSIKDFKDYKDSILLKLESNEKVITDLKLKINVKSASERKVDQVEIDRLEKRHEALKQKIENYKPGLEQKWDLFKVDFNKELDDFGKSLSKMSERNMQQ
jgi:phage regulator Rha-like protein